MLVRPGFEPTASRSADRRSPNWVNRAAVSLKDSLTDMWQEGDREYESDQLTSLCHKLKENYGKELKYTEGDSKGKKYREKIHVEILSHMP